MTGRVVRSLREVRLVPVVLVATIGLFALKALGLALDGGYLFYNASAGPDQAEITGTIAAGKDPSAAAKQSWAHEMFNFPGSGGSVESIPSPPRPGIAASPPGSSPDDITGAVGDTAAPKKPEAPAGKGEGAAKKPQEPPPSLSGTPVPLEAQPPVSQAERAVLESLQKRRAELDARAHELDLREDLLRAAEKRVAGRIDELKDLEARVGAAVQQKDDAEAARFKNVVAMYENMKAKDAAKIFDGLDIKVLLDVAQEINPRRMSDILALMTPGNAQRLTVELAARSGQKDASQTADLPKIQGTPSPN
jgi:flagellar motility protein MotE (MotC chaperone)